MRPPTPRRLGHGGAPAPAAPHLRHLRLKPRRAVGVRVARRGLGSAAAAAAASQVLGREEAVRGRAADAAAAGAAVDEPELLHALRPAAHGGAERAQAEAAAAAAAAARAQAASERALRAPQAAAPLQGLRGGRARGHRRAEGQHGRQLRRAGAGLRRRPGAGELRRGRRRSGRHERDGRRRHAGGRVDREGARRQRQAPALQLPACGMGFDGLKKASATGSAHSRHAPGGGAAGRVGRRS
jgi:hypothetical protein